MLNLCSINKIYLALHCLAIQNMADRATTAGSSLVAYSAVVCGTDQSVSGLSVGYSPQTGHQIKSNQIKSLLLSHHHSTSALVSEILMSVLQTVQKKKNYIFTDCTEDNVQNTHTYTQYT